MLPRWSAKFKRTEVINTIPSKSTPSGNQHSPKLFALPSQPNQTTFSSIVDSRPRIVLKFGGRTVSTREQWDSIASIAEQNLVKGRHPIIVCGAAKKVSRDLDALLEAALQNGHHKAVQAVKEQHLTLADALCVDGLTLLAPYFDCLDRLTYGISLTREAGPAARVRILSAGELMLTTLGAAFLNNQGFRTAWHDARVILRAESDHYAPLHEQYFSCQCDHAPDPQLQKTLQNDFLTLTQGFIAGNQRGETVLLGWGGSDTSAAYLATKLEAERLEIWTDVPGMFTADPHSIPSARLLKLLEYDEAEEIASAGADVLYPRSIDPLRKAAIPLHIRSSEAPHLKTIIAPVATPLGPQVKAIATRSGITLIGIETPRMWHSVGFLARTFRVFKRHGISVGLVATSETHVTISIDPLRSGGPAPHVIQALITDLNKFCKAEKIQHCASVSLVGYQIRSILHRLGPAFESIGEQQIHLVSQAASNRNFTFVVDESQAQRLVVRLHNQIFGYVGHNELFGPTYREISNEDEVPKHSLWWRQRRDELLSLPTPQYVYDADTLRSAAERVLDIGPIDRCFYAMKANHHPDVLRVFHDAGLGFECVSLGELRFLKTIFPCLDRDRILFTPNFAPRWEYAQSFRLAGHVTIDSLHPLENWPKIFSGQKIIIRVDPGQGAGHHQHVRTAGKQSKFGIVPEALPYVGQLAEKAGATIVGFHSHVGSGIMNPSTWIETAFLLASLAEDFGEVHLLNIGGGFGVPERPGASALDIDSLADGLVAFRETYPQLELWIEPGRYLVAEAGVLLARVTQIKKKETTHYVGVETGMNSLIRPALYGSYHSIVNLSRLDDPPAITAEIVGPICETGDTLGHGRRLPKTKEGDVLLIANAGAYGNVMSTTYNLRVPAEENFLRGLLSGSKGPPQL